MWSYLRRFSRMTKEMRPSHRIDILTDAIIYYRQKRIDNIGTAYILYVHVHIRTINNKTYVGDNFHYL